MKNNYFSKAISASRRYRLQLLCLMAMVLFSAQSYGQVGAYTFAQTTDTYTAITTGGVLLGDTTTDDNSFGDPALPTTTVLAGPGIPIGFNFTYGGYTFDRVGVNANGWISLGNSALTPSVNLAANSYTPLSATNTTTPLELRCRIAGLAGDLQSQGPGLAGGAGVSGNIRVVTVGTAPNRTLVVQFTGYRRYNAVGDNLNFQIRLNEGANTVQIRYGTMVLAASSTFQVGLGGISNGEFNNRTTTTDWSATTAGALNSATMTLSSTVAPASGLTYGFTPPVAGNIVSAASGNWSNPATWVGGIIPHYLSDVTIADGHVVTVDVSSVFIPTLTVGGSGAGSVVNFNGAAVRNFTVTGSLTVTPGDTFTTVPTTGTSARQVFVNGNIVNNGVMDLSTNGTILVMGGTAQTLGGTGSFVTGTIREIQSNGLTINMPINVSARYTLVDGILTTNGNLTMDNTLGGVVTGGVTFRRSVVSPSIVGAVNVGATAVYNLEYVVFTGQVTPVVCSTGTEIPASRTINGIRLAGGTGTQLVIAGGNLTMTSASNSTATTFPNTATAPGALIFSSGIFVVPSGSEMILSSGALLNITGGTATAYINGKLTWTVAGTAAQTRNFSIGNGTDRFLVVLAGFIPGATAQTYSAELTGAPSGAGVSPLNGILGTRGVKITSSAPLSATATVQLNWSAADALATGNISQLRVAQAASLTGPWTERSIASGTGAITATGNRTTAAGVDLANGEYFAFGTTSPGEVVVTAITDPLNKGCFTATETVKAVVRNNGTAFDRSASNVVVRGIVTAPSGTITTLAAVTRNAGTFASLTNDTITFTTPVNMVDTGNYIVRVFIDTIAGQLAAGDTLNRTIRSAVYTATATPALILTSQSATLSVNTNDVGVFAPNTSLVRISEVVAFRVGVGQQAAYPAYVPATAGDFVELTNFGDTAQSIAGWGIEIFNTGARTYAFPAGTVIPANSVLVLHVGPGTDDPANRYYNTGGVNDGISSTSAWGVTLKNAAGSLIDAVAIRAFTFGAATGVTAADWSGTTVSTSSAGVMLVGFDNNKASNWQNSLATGPLTNIGSLNPNMTYAPATVSWAGPGGFTATGFTASTGVRNTPATETYTATITSNGCAKTASTSLQVVAPIVPVAGFTVSSATATTGAVVSTVTLTDTSLNVPFQRRWTITPNTVTFVNGTNDSSIAPQVQFTAVGSYSVKLRVSNPAGTDSLTRNNAVTVALGYCASNATSTGDTKIDSVMLGTALTGSASNTCQAYTNFADSLGVVAVITKTQPFPMMVRSGYCGTTGYAARGRVFIDFNKDGSFTANEAVADFGPLTATGSGSAREWFNMNLIVPVSADTGIARLRVVYREDAATFADVLGCGTYGYGETEDYLVRITNPIIANPVLASPANNTLLNVNGPDQVRVNINWTPATRFTGTGAPATYTWQLASRAAGNFNTPLLSLTSNNAGADTALTLTLAQLDAALASLNVSVGDTVRGIWRVRAITGTDTLFSPATWNIDIRRGTITEAVTAFSLVTPPNNTILPVVGPGSQTAQIRWTTPVVAGSAPITYQWLAIAPNGNFNAPLVTLNANASDTSLTLTYSALNALLASLNVNLGDTARLDWTVRATSGTFTRLATQTWRISLVRGGLAPLRLAVAPVGTTTTQVRAPNGFASHTFLRAATFVPRTELAAASVDSGVFIQTLSFRVTAGADLPNKGRFVLYLGNGSNTTYTRGTAWTGALTGLNVAYDDSLSLRTTAGVMTLNLSQPFLYTGGSIEIAYDWNAVAPFASVAPVTYAANSAIASSLVSAASATAAPATLAATAFRPEFIWGVDDRKANEVEVITMFAKGRNPRNYGTPETIQAIVRNNGYQARTNLPVTLSVAGANTFTNVQTIASLASDSTQLVTFSAFTGTSVGFNNMTVSVPVDDNVANNAKTWAQEQTDSIFSYNDSVTVGNGAVGYNTGAGLLLSRFSINGTRSVAAARIRIGDAAAIAGNSVSAVVLNDSGVIVSQSAPVALTAADLRTWVVFPFSAPVNITNGNFYIGLAQTANAVGYFPVAFQAETPTRANAYFTGPVTGGVVPSPVAGFRLMIEAHVGPQFVPADTLSRFNLVAPSNNTTLNIQGDPAQTAQIRWRSSTRTGGIGTTTYQWLLDVPAGDFSNPVLRVNAGTDTSLTLTYGQIVDSLAAKGVQVGSGFAGRWNVLATNGPVSRLANIPFTITLNRGVMTSIEETDFSKSISLYPNPAAYSAKLQINTPGDKELSIVIVNAVGQEMKKFNVSSSIANDIELDLTSLNQGLYFVRVTNGSEMAIKRLMIQR